jgi:hypothetical protein
MFYALEGKGSRKIPRLKSYPKAFRWLNDLAPLVLPVIRPIFSMKSKGFYKPPELRLELTPILL